MTDRKRCNFGTLYVYWCPRCNVQSERPWHLCKKGPALIPQLDEETHCERIEVVPVCDARVTELEAALWRTRKAGNEAVDLALAVYGWAVYPRNGAALRMKADRLRSALAKEDTDE